MVNNISKIIPPEIQAAYDLLISEALVEIIEPLAWCEDEKDGKGWVFKFNTKITTPNKAEIPDLVKIRVLIREPFPFVPIVFYSEEETVKGFPHQDAVSGKLCLPEEYEFPISEKKLVEYIKAVKTWLNDASGDNLLKAGEPYELPDFSKSIKFPPFLFDETNQSFELWASHVGETGTVIAKLGKEVRGIFGVEFSNEDGSQPIWNTRFKENSFNDEAEIYGSWILIPDIRYMRHRPPQTFKEIIEVCRKFNIDFSSVMKKCWREDNRVGNKGLVLIGFPIPLNVGEDSREIHWQAIFFENSRVARKNAANPKKFKSGKKWINFLSEYFSGDKPIPWVTSVNISKNRLLARGANPNPVSAWNVSLFGCGSLGSSIGEMLVKGGMKELNLFDHDILQYGNLCRHCLDGGHLGENKSEALANRLSKSNPFLPVKGFNLRIPGAVYENPVALKVIDDSNLIIECTTSDAAAEWLSIYADNRKIRMVTIFLSWKAKYLTLYISSKTTSNVSIYKDIKEVLNQLESPIPEEYRYKPTESEQILEGAGCWHPTFPASYTDIQMLSASGLSLLLSHLKNNTKKGFAAIIKRNDEATDQYPSSLTEIIWTKIYP